MNGASGGRLGVGVLEAFVADPVATLVLFGGIGLIVAAIWALLAWRRRRREEAEGAAFLEATRRDAPPGQARMKP